MKVQREEENFLTAWKSIHRRDRYKQQNAKHDYEIFFNKMDQRFRRRSPNHLVENSTQRVADIKYSKYSKD